MVEDSLLLGARVGWYTTMLGSKASLKPLRRALAQRRITCVHTTEFSQVDHIHCHIIITHKLYYIVIAIENWAKFYTLTRKGKTHRWAVAWTLDPRLVQTTVPEAVERKNLKRRRPLTLTTEL